MSERARVFLHTPDAAKALGISTRQFFKNVKKLALKPLLVRHGSHRVALWTNVQIDKLKKLRQV